MRRTTCCQPVGPKCGTLIFDAACPICKVAADLVHLVDLRRSITLKPWPGRGEPQFERVLDGTHVVHLEDSLYGEVLAELVGVDHLPGQGILNSYLRLLLNLARALVVWAKGEKVYLAVVFGLKRAQVRRANL